MPLELIVGAAVGAAAANPTIRNAVRQSMIRGLGGLLMAYDKAAAMAHEAAKAARDGAAAAKPAPANGTPAAPATSPAPASAPAAPAAP